MRIFYDVDTQNDFMNSDGALYVPDAELIKPNLMKLTDYAKEKRISIFGSVDKHFGTEEYKPREGELQKWGGPFPDHCMDGTEGQKKINETKLYWFNNPKEWGFDNASYLSHRLDEKVDVDKIVRLLKNVNENIPWEKSGLFFEKQSYDVFTNPITEIVLAKAKVDEAIVYGVATDYCVKAAVMGMQQRGIQTYIVEDAIKGVTPETTKSALEEMAKAGAKFVTTKDVLGGRV